MKEKKLLEKQLAAVERREWRALQKGKGLIARKAEPLAQKLEEKIPEAARGALRAAFEKGFTLVFSSGAGVIEKTCARERLQASHAAGLHALDGKASRWNLNRFERAAGRQALCSKGIAAAEGGVLGVFGIGLPDIPLFLGVLLRTVYQIALSYGFDYRSGEERIFILGLLSTAAAPPEARAEASARTDRIGFEIDQGQTPEWTLDEAVRDASDRLCAGLLTAKAVQGLPVVGVVGAAVNYNMTSRVSKVATLKYQKRFLARRRREARE